MSLAARNVRTSLSLLVILYVSVLLAGFLTPYVPTEQNRDMPFAPPTRLHLAEATGRVHLRPFVYRLASDPRSFGEYIDDLRTIYPIRFLARGAPYRIAGFFLSIFLLYDFDDPSL